MLLAFYSMRCPALLLGLVADQHRPTIHGVAVLKTPPSAVEMSCWAQTMIPLLAGSAASSGAE